MLIEIVYLIIYSAIACGTMLLAENFMIYSILSYVIVYYAPTGYPINIIIIGGVLFSLMIISLGFSALCLSYGIEIVFELIG